ncbi:MAG: type II toxin-antitoxin system death-on-curing family toxin [Oscillospiraceae bacterium]
MIQLTKAQILLLHKQLLAATGGDTALLNDGLLKAALSAPFQSYDGEMLFPSIHAQAARLGFGLTKNHAFADGNKRIGAHAMLVFLALNDIELLYTQAELSDVFIAVAENKANYNNLLQWIVAHQKQ